MIFVVLYALSRRVPPRPRGTFIGTFLLMYGVFRFLIEFVRVPDAQIGYTFGWVTRGQMLSVPVAIAGVVVLLIAWRRHVPQATRVTRTPRSRS